MRGDFLNFAPAADIIKKKSNPDDPILVISYENWQYLYLDRPIATYTAWIYKDQQEQLTQKRELLITYYKKNKSKLPKYIYFPYYEVNGIPYNKIQFSAISDNSFFDNIYKMFDCTQENLPNGVLFTVNGCKFDLNS